jgi:hypothetical protein
VGVQARWEDGGTEPEGEYTFSYGKWKVFFVHKRIIPVVKRVEFISDRMSYILLSGVISLF